MSQPLVLVVDSYLDNLSLMKEFLGFCGCSAAIAADGTSALQNVAHQPPDLIFTELILPGFSGLELVKRFREELTAVPIVAVTSCLSVQYRERALAAGCDEFVEKPYSLDQLEALIVRFLTPPFRASA